MKDERGRRPPRSGARNALTTAALALPGLALPITATAQENGVDLLFGQFRETARNLNGLRSAFAPLQSDSMQMSGKLTPADGWTGIVNYRQDTWSGATPVATAPGEWRGNRSRAPDGVSGATPYLVNTNGLYLDRRTLQPLRTDGYGTLTGGENAGVVHTISGASRETRRQIDASFMHEKGDTAFGVNGGVSDEPDYRARFIGGNARLGFDQRRTTLSLDAGFSSMQTNATLDHDATPYIFNACGSPACNFLSPSATIRVTPAGSRTVSGNRHDWSARIGITQVVHGDGHLDTSLGFTRQRGYLDNPYKVVSIAFADPNLQFLSPDANALYITTGALLEQRPATRNQWLFNLRYAQFLPATDGALHLDLSRYRDDWGIRSTTIKAEWVQPLGETWTITPSIRYYTQTAAHFYAPYLVTFQGEYRPVTDPATGRQSMQPFDTARLPAHYTSDARLAAFGGLGGGIGITRLVARGVTLGFGAEYYRRASGLKWRSGGSGSFADFSYSLLNATISVDLGPTFVEPQDHTPDPATHANHHAGHDAAAPAPAGVMFDHVLPDAGDASVALRVASSRQAGPMRHGTHRVGDAEIKSVACGSAGCLVAPTSMNMIMSMLEIMYAPTRWLTLMVMPTFTDMTMGMRGLLTAAEQGLLPIDRNIAYLHHSQHAATSGGLGDVGLYAAVSLLDTPGRRLIGTLGVTAPTGNAGVRLRDTHQIEAGYQHYTMQLGSGTWDFNPSLAYIAAREGTTWGIQATGTLRTGGPNRQGYRLGDVLQTSVWGAREWTDGWSASVRGILTWQGAIRGHFDSTLQPASPMDVAANTGGWRWEVGVGTQYAARHGPLAGNTFGIECLVPLRESFNGYQQERRPSFHGTWRYHF